MSDVRELAASLTGELFDPGSRGYESVRRPVNAAFQHIRPRLVVRCRSAADVVCAVRYAVVTGEHLVPRGGGHCFAGRSSTSGIVLDMTDLDDVTVAEDGVATIGAGARLGRVYAALHTQGRTLPAGCGATVGITGLTLGGGIGLLGRRYGLTCDRLVGVQIVLADGRLVDCDPDHEADLFWALRGAGGGQFGVVTKLRFDTVAEPMAIRIQAQWSDVRLDDLILAWQTWAPDAPDEMTANLTFVSEPGAPVQATLFGGCTLAEEPTRELLHQLIDQAGPATTVELHAAVPFHQLKLNLAEPPDPLGHVNRSRSEFVSSGLSPGVVAALLSQLTDATTTGRRQLGFTAMGGAYNRVAEDATAFAHRAERFLLEHRGPVLDPWVDESWATAHPDGSGRVYPNFPDPAIDNWAAAYHGSNHPRLVAIKHAYDPYRFFHFPQAI